MKMMKNRWMTGVLFAALVAFAAPAFAQDGDVETRFYDFNDMLID